ncbi:MAG TPA: hypothetical protein VHD87_16580 [Acidimicrobiales bacterium]|nr:hypothetical protein [Acidimicrobiales bacterium]
MLPAALSLLVLDVAVLATQPPTPPPVRAATPAPVTTTIAVTTTTTPLPPPPPPTTAPPTTAAPRTVTTAAPAPRPATPTTAAAAAAPVHTHSGRESCGWAWDGLRIDDGSSNAVTMTLDAPRRPNETVTITAAFGGPDTADASRTTTTDGAGQATAKFAVSEDKRDWTITISALFATGGACDPQTFTLDY